MNFVIEKVEVCFFNFVIYDFLVRIVENIGYGVLLVNIELLIEGMICVLCVGWVECVFVGVKGVCFVYVNFVIEWVMVEGIVFLEDFVKVVENVGYDVVLIGDIGVVEVEVSVCKDVEWVGLKCDFLVVGILILLVFLLEMGLYFILVVYYLVM